MSLLHEERTESIRSTLRCMSASYDSRFLGSHALQVSPLCLHCAGTGVRAATAAVVEAF
jgi:hypothetical protein